MRSNYKKLGQFITKVDVRNKNLQTENLQGLSMTKEFRKSTSNIVGTNLKKYKIVGKNQFACDFMSVIRVHKLPVVLHSSDDLIIISPAYTVFKIIDEAVLNPEYLMMWFRRGEFDRYADFRCDSAIRGGFKWDELCETELPVPSIVKQQEIVKEYNVVKDRIKLNEQLKQKLEDAAQAIYKHWFVDFEFPAYLSGTLSGGEGYKSSGGAMVYNEELEKEIPEGWSNGTFQNHVKVKMGQSPKGNTYNQNGYGTPLINGPVEFGVFFTEKRKWTSAPTKLCDKGDLIICVRGSTVGRFVKSDGIYCLGRGVCSFKGIHSQRFVDELYKCSLEKLLSYTTGSTFPNLDGQTLLNFPAIIPSAELVKLFHQCSNSMFSVVEVKAKENIYLNKIQTLLLSKMAKLKEEKELV